MYQYTTSHKSAKVTWGEARRAHPAGTGVGDREACGETPKVAPEEMQWRSQTDREMRWLDNWQDREGGGGMRPRRQLHFAFESSPIISERDMEPGGSRRV